LKDEGIYEIFPKIKRKKSYMYMAKGQNRVIGSPLPENKDDK
jgi:hypothetical protein